MLGKEEKVHTLIKSIRNICEEYLARWMDFDIV